MSEKGNQMKRSHQHYGSELKNVDFFKWLATLTTEAPDHASSGDSELVKPRPIQGVNTDRLR